jgi:hypothetical protein
MIFLVEDKDLEQTLAYLSADLIDYSYWREVNKPENLQILSFNSTDGREGRYDFIAEIRNPNPNFVASRVLFQLISGGQMIAETTTFIFPNEEKYVAIFGQEVARGESPVLKIAEVDWWRYHQFEELAQPRLKFEPSEIEFKSARESGIRGDLPVSTLDFKLTNNSAYSYWQVGVYMVLLSRQKAVGANYISLDQFLAGETREIEMRWYESLPAVNQIEILPEVNILKTRSYMPVE